MVNETDRPCSNVPNETRIRLLSAPRRVESAPLPPSTDPFPARFPNYLLGLQDRSQVFHFLGRLGCLLLVLLAPGRRNLGHRLLL